MRRRLIQWTVLLMCNPLLMNFLDGRLYKGALKNICAPGLNCWSCPAAVLACPIGALQAIGGSMQFSLGLYPLGFMLLIGLLIGRTVLQTAVEKINTSARSRPYKIFCADRVCVDNAGGVDELRGLGRTGVLRIHLPRGYVGSGLADGDRSLGISIGARKFICAQSCSFVDRFDRQCDGRAIFL